MSRRERRRAMEKEEVVLAAFVLFSKRVSLSRHSRAVCRLQQEQIALTVTIPISHF